MRTSGRFLAAAVLLLLPLPAHAQGSGVSADSILAVARVLSGETGLGPPTRFAPLPSTQIYVEWLRDELDRRLAPLGGHAELAPFRPELDQQGPEEIREVYNNVIGVVPGALGAASPGCFMIGAHLDATSQRDGIDDESWDPFTAPAPGADDNGSGVSVVLEVARVMGERHLVPQADLIFALFDGEEQQLVEADRFLLGSGVLSDSLAEEGRRLYGFVNMDMVAYHPQAPDSLVIITNTRSRWLADGLILARKRPLGGETPDDLLLTRLVKGITFSDHGPFWENDFDAVLLIEAAEIVGYAPHYHRKTDTVGNTYSRGGAQAATTAELVLRMIDSWSEAGDPDPTLTSEDILVQQGEAVDLDQVVVGETVDVEVSFTNRGGTLRSGADLDLSLETVDGRPIRELGSQTVSEVVPAGARVDRRFPWTVENEERGVVNLVAKLRSGGTAAAERAVAVMSNTGDVVRAYVYPNPTREPKSAVLHYELARGGPVRLSVIDVRGQTAAELDLSFDPVFPSEGVDVGQSEIPLSWILQGADLAPGLYIARVEVFDGSSGGSRDVNLARFAVLR